MRQEKIRDLLAEAANPNCDWDRRGKIQHELLMECAALGADGVFEDETPSSGLHMLASSLFMEALENRPGKLLQLFPVFAMICGDRGPSDIVTDVEWDLT